MTVPAQKKVASAFRAPGAVDWRELESENTADKDQQEEAKKAKGELKNVLRASLQMQHLVVLAGSGCSQSAGGLSMLDLWNGAVGEEPTADAKATAGKVNHDIKDQNIEAFLSRVEAFLQVNQDTDVSDFLDASKQVILDKCSGFLDPTKLDTHKTFLHRLSRRGGRAKRLQVFTTNYDLCIERAAAELGGVALDGFSNGRRQELDDGADHRGMH